MAFVTIYDKDGQAYQKESVDARECLAVGEYFSQPPVVDKVAEVVEEAPVVDKAAKGAKKPE